MTGTDFPDEAPPGFTAPVRLALTQPILMGGAPRGFAILNGTLAVVLAFANQPIAGLAIGLLGHALGVLVARRDPDAFAVLSRAMRMRTRLEA